jgi:hypothetical protein
MFTVLHYRCLFVLASRSPSTLLQTTQNATIQPNRTFLPKLPNILGSSGGKKSGSNRRLEYSERRILG